LYVLYALMGPRSVLNSKTKINMALNMKTVIGCVYNVVHKKRASKLFTITFAITFANINQFSIIFAPI